MKTITAVLSAALIALASAPVFAAPAFSHGPVISVQFNKPAPPPRYQPSQPRFSHVEYRVHPQKQYRGNYHHDNRYYHTNDRNSHRPVYVPVARHR